MPPRVAERSGSPASWSGWDTLGLQGRSFVGGGRGPVELATINGTRPRTDPGVCRSRVRCRHRRSGRACARRIRSHGGVGSGGPCRGGHDGGRGGRSGCRRLRGVDVQRRYRHRGDAVLVPAEPGVVPGRPCRRCRGGLRSGRGHPPAVVAASSRPPPPARGVRRRPRRAVARSRLRRPGRAAAIGRRGTLRRSSEFHSVVAQCERSARSWHGGSAADLRRRARRPVRRESAGSGGARRGYVAHRERSVDTSAGAVPAAQLRSGGVAGSGGDVRTTGLAVRTARHRPQPRHARVPLRDVRAGDGRSRPGAATTTPI